jgi:hypothetical protein
MHVISRCFNIWHTCDNLGILSLSFSFHFRPVQFFEALLSVLQRKHALFTFGRIVLKWQNSGGPKVRNNRISANVKV